MFSLIRLCKVEGLSRNWQDIHHEQGGKLLRLLRKENWVWNAEIWPDRKLKLVCCSCHSLLATPWQVWLFQGVGIQRLLQFKDPKWLLLTFSGIKVCRFWLCLPQARSGNSSPRSFRWKNHGGFNGYSKVKWWLLLSQVIWTLSCIGATLKITNTMEEII